MFIFYVNVVYGARGSARSVGVYVLYRCEFWLFIVVVSYIVMMI